ncbi:MAG: ankyrin repeat domain-containing protein [Alphaproteobacteria bacterium]|nr:ankyrin repeat domain-containing protein [Alphaproteobacteria bacterium]
MPILKPLLLKAKQHYVFVLLSFLFVGLFLFHFWMAYPGFIMTDSQEFLLLYKNNWQPVCISYVMQFLFAIFGRHVYLLLLLNLIPFYLGIFFFSFGFYQKFRSKDVMLIVAVSLLFVSNHFFSNFNLLSSSIYPAFLVLLWGMTFYVYLNPISEKTKKYTFYSFLALIFLLTITSRHNAVLGVCPLGGMFFLDKNKTLFKKILYLFSFIILCVFFGLFFPNLVANEKSYPENHILLHRMAGTCVPADDPTCFPKEWYIPGKTWEDVKKVYMRHQTNADEMAGWWRNGKVFDGSVKKEKIKTYWLKAILKYPHHYLNQALMYWHIFENGHRGKPTAAYLTQERTRDRDKYDQLIQFFDQEELYISFSETQHKIYNFLTPKLLLIKTKWFVWGLYFICTVSLIYFLKKRLFTFMLFASCAGLLNMIGASLFSPVTSQRYVLSVSILFFISLVGYITFLKENYTPDILIKKIFRNGLIGFIIIFWGMVLFPKKLNMIYLARNDKPLWQFQLSAYLGNSATEKDETGRTALSWASAHISNPKVIEFLAERNTKDINLPDTRWNAPPIHFALDHNPNEDVIEKLIDIGTDINIRNGAGHSVLIRAVSRPLSDRLIKKILSCGADIHIFDIQNKANALHWACDHNNSLEVIKMLVEQGSNVNNLDNMNRTPLMKVAARNTNPKIMQYLIDKGASLDIQDKNGMTALIRGCRDNKLAEVLLLLIKANANVLLKDKRGKTALDYAKNNIYLQNTNLIFLLEEKMKETTQKTEKEPK